MVNVFEDGYIICLLTKAVGWGDEQQHSKKNWEDFGKFICPN